MGFKIFDTYAQQDGETLTYSSATINKGELNLLRVEKGCRSALYRLPDCVCICANGFTAEELIGFEQYAIKHTQLVMDFLGIAETRNVRTNLIALLLIRLSELVALLAVPAIITQLIGYAVPLVLYKLAVSCLTTHLCILVLQLLYRAAPMRYGKLLRTGLCYDKPYKCRVCNPTDMVARAFIRYPIIKTKSKV